MKRLRHCGNGHYTLKETCPRCGQETKGAHPPSFSPHDKYADYRRRIKYGP